jgi:hypothetical protein
MAGRLTTVAARPLGGTRAADTVRAEGCGHLASAAG